MAVVSAWITLSPTGLMLPHLANTWATADHLTAILTTEVGTLGTHIGILIASHRLIANATRTHAVVALGWTATRSEIPMGATAGIGVSAAVRLRPEVDGTHPTTGGEGVTQEAPLGEAAQQEVA